MGVQSLMKVISELAPEAIEPVDERALFESGESLAIDVTIVIHRYMHADPYRPNLAGDIVRKFAPLVARAPSSVFVFDGAPRPEKAATKAKRERRRNDESAQLARARERLSDGPPTEEAASLKRLIESLERRCVDPTDEAIESVRARLESLGWNVEIATHDAEERVAQLVRSGQCDAGYTDDSDALVWGCPTTLIRVGKARQLSRIRLDRVLDALDLTHAQFVDASLLLGTDFTATTLEGIGPKRALPLVRRYGSIEGIVKAHEKHRGRIASGDFDYVAARAIFAC